MTAARLVTRLLTLTKCPTLHLGTKGPTLGSLAEQARVWRVRQGQQRVRWAQRREQVCHTPPARTANPSLLTYILARGTLAAAMTPIRALASSTTPLSTHLSPALHDQP